MTATTPLDTVTLAAWMDAIGLPGRGAPVETAFLSGGSQNEIFEIRRGDFHAALRKPPISAPSSRDEGILREWRIIQALAGTDVPHTPAIAMCADSSVLGRPFYLMGFVDGWSPVEDIAWPEPFASDLSTRPALAEQLVEGVVLLGQVDWLARGLGDLGRPEGYHERQVSRWTRFYERVRSRDVPGYDEATRWLDEHRPIDFVPGIMHGDYQFANVMYQHGAPARLAAIIDWEMGTIGDPKLDLAWLMHSWPEDTVADGSKNYVDLTGMPGRTALIEYYAQRSGRQVDDMDYYQILAKWKLAIVLEQGYQRAGDDPKLQSFGPLILDLMAGAAELAASSDYRVTR
ncbi:acyl-CoA dehydrogenase [Nocardia nova]|uniref:Acyl-CoA dehydrogenase n=1 Tax=Nocardia nova TaxID=37330 RepID=A0A2S6AVQ5_9NOCA|nr:phosphotransferase family protein [Nocardia nova]PPJ33488.1 acyl-CoA dehydrogenase [Nocardia nova]PPJ39279.1 acyl-CoA dehydrogenase [Nocardia nova]